jgi:hypothetical protein
MFWLDRTRELAVPLVVSALAACFIMIGVFLLIIAIGSAILSDEWSYGVPLVFGPPIALIVGALTFLGIFRKMRSLD